MQEERKSVNTPISDLHVSSIPFFQFPERKFFPPRAFAYAILSVQNGLCALIIDDVFSPFRIHLKWFLLKKAFPGYI